jgi:hypothetical protein
MSVSLLCKRYHSLPTLSLLWTGQVKGEAGFPVTLLRLFFLVQHISEMLKCCEVMHLFYFQSTPFKNMIYSFFLILLHIHTVHSESRCKLTTVLEVMSTSVYTGLNPFNFIWKYFLQICIRKAAVHLYKVLEMMSTSVYTGLNRNLSAQRLSEHTVV